MTIKNQNKTISAETQGVVTNASFNPTTGVLTLTLSNLRDGTTISPSLELDLSKHKLRLIKTTQAELDRLAASNADADVELRRSNIFLVSKDPTDGEGVYQEHVWVQDESDPNDHGAFEIIGSTKIDLTPYIEKVNIADDLTTNDNTKVLSAKQGKKLQDDKVNKSDIATNLTTNDDTKVLSAKQGKKLQDDKVNKSDIATNLTTNDDTKVLSAKQGKNLQDNKVNKTDIATDLTTNDDTKVLSAKQGKKLQDNKEENSNKTQSISSSSTPTQYPSAKAVYDYIDTIIGNIERDMNS